MSGEQTHSLSILRTEGLLVAPILVLAVIILGMMIAAGMNSTPQVRPEAVAEVERAKRLVAARMPGADVLAWRTSGGVLAIDRQAARMLVADRSDDAVLSPRDIVEITLHEVTHTSGRAVGTTTRALIGGAIAGTPGALVGALGAERTTITYGEIVRISIVTNDLLHPSWDFWGFGRPGKSDLPMISLMQKESDGEFSLTLGWLRDIAPYLKAFAAQTPQAAGATMTAPSGFCPDCGFPRRQGERFCSSCGHEHDTM